MSFSELNAIEPYNATYMLPLLRWSVHQVTWKSGVAPWTECLLHDVFMFSLSRNEVICWSKIGSQESNNTGFWHLSVLGLDGGTPQRDLWKLAATVSLLNFMSWSLADLDSGGAEKIG
jgi:hypothetical protein